jgi:transcriptional regulator with XRE-family HTH domain
MELAKRQKLEAAGWKVTTVAEFLDLSPEEMDLIEIRLSLSKLLKQFREQQKLAENVNFSRAQVAKIEASNTDGAIDLLIKSLLSLGATREDIATAVSGK